MSPNRVCEELNITVCIWAAIVKLYNSKSDVFLRETTQNAVDSLLKKNSPLLLSGGDFNSEDNFIKINVKYIPEPNTKTIFKVVFVSDNGIGVTPNRKDDDLFNLFRGNRQRILLGLNLQTNDV